jgi:hypothetical protein
MHFQVEFNILPVESVYESDGWAYGVLSSTAPASSLFGPLRVVEHVSEGHIKRSLLVSDYTHQQLRSEECIGEAPLIEFVNLRDGDAEQATRYLRRYGLFSLDDLKTGVDPRVQIDSIPPYDVFGPYKRDPHIGLPEKLQTYWDDSYNKGLIPFTVRLEQLWTVRRWLTHMLSLAKAVREQDESIVESLAPPVHPSVVRTFPELVQRGAFRFAHLQYPELIDKAYRGGPLPYAKYTLRSSLSLALAEVVVGAREQKGCLVPTIASYGIRDALALHVLNHIHRETSLGECQNPKCKKLFFVTRNTKRFCSERCQALIRVRRHRDLKKLRLQKKKKGGTTPNPIKQKGGK